MGDGGRVKKPSTIEFSLAEQPTEEFAIPAGGWDAYATPDAAGSLVEPPVVLVRRRRPVATAGLLGVVLVVGMLAGVVATVVLQTAKSSKQSASEPPAVSIPTGLPSVAPKSIPTQAASVIANQSSPAARATTPAKTKATAPATGPAAVLEPVETTPVTPVVPTPRIAAMTPARPVTQPAAGVATGTTAKGPQSGFAGAGGQRTGGR
jgi:hypothetical protein